jgi:hypothetical protein
MQFGNNIRRIKVEPKESRSTISYVLAFLFIYSVIVNYGSPFA